MNSFETREQMFPRVEHFLPPQLTEEDYIQLGLPAVAAGYGVEGTEADHLNIVKKQLGQTDQQKHIYLALEDDKAVGYLVTGHYTLSGEPLRGTVFWNSIIASSEALFQSMQEQHSEVVEMAGMVVKPEHRRQGIARDLMTQAYTDIKPSVIVGYSKTPAQVYGRATTTASLGYRTLFGSMEVTPGVDTREGNDLRLFFTAYTAALDRIQKGMFIHSNGVPADLYSTDEFPSYIQEAFIPLVAEQEIIQETTPLGSRIPSVQMPLISVKQSLVALVSRAT